MKSATFNLFFEKTSEKLYPIYVRHVSFNDGDMVLEAAKECVSLQHQMFEENWDIFDSQSETTSDSDETGSDSSADECSVSDPSNEEYF